MAVTNFGITHGFAGWCKIGASRVLCREGASLVYPRNLDIPYPISYQPYGQLNVADGVRYPVLQVPAIPMRSVTPAGAPLSDDEASWFTYENLNDWFMDRSIAPEFDISEVPNGIEFSDNAVVNADGIGTFRIRGAKGAGFSLNVDKGAPIGFNMRWAGISCITQGTGLETLAAPPYGLQGEPLNSGQAYLGGVLADIGVIGVTLDFDTALTPNMVLDGTNNPIEHNADLPTCTLTIRQNAMVGVNPPGLSIVNGRTVATEVGNASIIIRNAWTGVAAGTAVVFTITRMILIDPDDRRQMRGRVTRMHRYNCIATITAPPLVISSATWSPP